MEKLLEEACRYEQLARDCGPFDPAYNYMMQQSRICFEEALQMEKVQ